MAAKKRGPHPAALVLEIRHRSIQHDGHIFRVSNKHRTERWDVNGHRKQRGGIAASRDEWPSTVGSASILCQD